MQIMWSCSGKTMCLWSADTGAWLGKIGGDRELEEAPTASSGSGFFEGGVAACGAHGRDVEQASFSSELGGRQINSAKVGGRRPACCCLVALRHGAEQFRTL
jgi:hypothetical protein